MTTAGGRDKFDAAAMRRMFLERSWNILMKYLERLDDDDMRTAIDARAGAGVVKTLFDAVDKAEAGAPYEEDDVEFPEIPQETLDEIIEKILGKDQESVPETTGKTGRAKKSGVALAKTAEC